jgi:hypothetical protein
MATLPGLGFACARQRSGNAATPVWLEHRHAKDLGTSRKGRCRLRLAGALPVYQDVADRFIIHPRDQEAFFAEDLIGQIIGVSAVEFTAKRKLERCQILSRYRSDISLAHLH